MDTSQYLDVFIEESADHLEVLSTQLLALEKKPKEKKIIEEIFRAAHTLKGMAATMGYTDLADVTHHLENVFDSIRYDKLNVQSRMIDVLFETVDYLNEIVEDIAAGGEGKRDVTRIIEILSALNTGETLPDQRESLSEVAATITATEEVEHIEHMDEFELTILQESIEQGFSNYEIHVELSKNCLLKGARVFMVFEVLEQLGEVVKSQPTVNELEEEAFDYTFTVLLISKHPQEEIQQKIHKVSEIEKIKIIPFSPTAYTAKKHEDERVHKETKDTPTKDQKESTPTKTPVARQTIRVNIERLDVLMNLFEELLIDRGRLETISSELNHTDLTETVERMTRVSGDLQNIILNMRMVPIDTVFNRFPRMVRQLARELEKQVEVQIIGADTELDRTVIDQIGDPLVHLIRNAMDHGIETPEKRKNSGKNEQGTITLEAYHSGNYVIIEIADDGAGINQEKVLKGAIEKGVVGKEEAALLDEQQVYELIMASGFSTSETVSDVSGRGVGLDVVKNTIETLGGSITIDATPGKGSIFSIQLPLTLSIISVMLIELENEKYAIPLSSVIETAIVRKEDILSAHHKKVIDFRGQVIPLVFLHDVFEVSQSKNRSESAYVSIVIIKKGEKLAGLVVDSFIGQQEVVLKSLGAYLTNTYAISGATILGDGEVALIIDSNALIK